MEIVHEPVMVSEVLQGLRCRSGGTYVDGTMGQGGHSQAILAASAPTGRVIGLDRDPEAIMAAAQRLFPDTGRFRLFHRCYSRLGEVLQECGPAPVDGILLDLGLSSSQLEQSRRGFSFQGDQPLDMRMDPQEDAWTAADILNRYSERELADLFWRLGEERYARRLARRIVATRQSAPLAATAQLVELIQRTLPGRPGGRRLHPATRVFQALRIAVNRELERLEAFLAQAPEFLTPGGRLVIIAYHSLEDRLVKHAFLDLEKTGRLTRVTRKPLTPGEAEVRRNPRARSAKLRIAERPAVDRVQGREDSPARV